MEVEKKSGRGKKEVSLIGLFGKQFLEEMQNKLAEATGVSFFIIDYKGEPVTKGEKEEKFCKERKKEDEKCSECQISRAFAAAKSAIKNCTHIFTCPNGLVHMAIPVIVNNQYIGAMVGGPIRCEEKALKESELGENEKERKQFLEKLGEQKEYQSIPAFTEKRIAAIADMVFLLFKEMGEKETVAIRLGALEHKEVHLSDIRKKNKLLEDKVNSLEHEILKGKLPKQFMLNLLTTISSFSIIENANRTENIIAEMAGVLRYYLDNSSEIIPLSEELKQIEAYLDVLRQQYDDRLEYRVYCQEEVEKQKIPIVGLFPFVEQLVDFGVFSGHFRGTLYIDAEKKEEYCQIVLQLESSGLSMGHFGADITDSNFVQMQEADIRKRYAKEFGKDFEITVDPNVVTVKIPFQQIK